MLTPGGELDKQQERLHKLPKEDCEDLYRAIRDAESTIREMTSPIHYGQSELRAKLAWWVMALGARIRNPETGKIEV